VQQQRKPVGALRPSLEHAEVEAVRRDRPRPDPRIEQSAFER
jgi:hypothetical protein